jgi:hypothetical protein
LIHGLGNFKGAMQSFKAALKIDEGNEKALIGKDLIFEAHCP